MITLRDLEQYEDLRKERKELQERITYLKQTADVQHARVRGSMDGWPYVERSFTVTGMSKARSKALTESLIRYSQLEAEIAAKLREIEDWIATVGDARVRRILRLRYVDGKSWRMVAQKVYGSPAYESAAKKRIYRLFPKCPECPELEM